MEGAVIMQGLFYPPAGPKQRIPIQQNKPNPDKETKCYEVHLTPAESRVSELSNESLKGDSCAALVFTAGSTSAHMDTWCQITSDRNILTAVSGYKIEFGPALPTQFRAPRPTNVSKIQAIGMDLQIAKFLEKGVIVKSAHEPDEFISNVFLREKKDGSYRIILNLKNLNQWAAYHHFKMDTIQTCNISLMKPGCYMASIDLRDAYFSIPVHASHQKYLKFMWKGTLYKFTCLPQRLGCSPRVLTKVLKPVFSHLRQRGHISSGYIDDTFLEGDSYNLCEENVSATMQSFRGLGFWPHDLKSVTEPTQILEHLGFVLNSLTMTVSLSDEKFDKLYQLSQRILESEKVSIRLVASLIGIMASFCPGVEYGQLYYRQIEIEKTIALKIARGDFDQNMILSHDKAKNDIKWWLAHAKISKRKSKSWECYYNFVH